MPKIGGYTKTLQYARRQRAVGRFRSPYQKGGTIGRSLFPPTRSLFPIRVAPWWEKPPLRRIKAVNPRRKRKRR